MVSYKKHVENERCFNFKIYSYVYAIKCCNIDGQ